MDATEMKPITTYDRHCNLLILK